MSVGEIAHVGCRLERKVGEPTLQEVQRWHNVESLWLAQLAGLDDADEVRQIWIGRRGRFTVDVVARVLEALSGLVGVTYTLDDVSVQFRAEQMVYKTKAPG